MKKLITLLSLCLIPVMGIKAYAVSITEEGNKHSIAITMSEKFDNEQITLANELDGSLIPEWEATHHNGENWIIVKYSVYDLYYPKTKNLMKGYMVDKIHTLRREISIATQGEVYVPAPHYFEEKDAVGGVRVGYRVAINPDTSVDSIRIY